MCGIDEVGRGCLAGPVTVAALVLPQELRIKNYELGKLKDSKKLTAKKREEWFAWLKQHPKIFYAKVNVYPKTIDRINISQAANLAATRAVKKLITHNSLPINKIKILLDGGLYLNKILDSRFQILTSRTVVKGDEKYNAIKLASIVAKVHRDRIMKRNHKKYPLYGFDQHVGYGTHRHIAAIRKHGFSEIHRLTFLKNFVKV